MHLTTLKLQHFRNHLDTSFEFGDGTNILLGDNGQGKTNVIEAISYLCLTKSFYAGSDSLVLNFGKSIFDVAGMFVSDAGIESNVRVVYSEPQGEKAFVINRKRIDPFSSVIGKFPVVICSPEHSPITMGAPGERRKFIDLILSQSSSTYFQDLLEYRRGLKQRNKILFDAKTSRTDCSAIIEPWNEQLVKLGCRIMYRRKNFVSEFQSFVASAYEHFVDKEEEPAIEYKPTIKISSASSESEIQELLRVEQEETREEEKRIGTTLIGPQRDEYVLKINGLELRKFASQGQHKTFLVASKIAEFFYLKERCNETPILLLDDVFSELDEHRIDRVLQFVRDLSQTFITSTSSQLFDSTTLLSERNRKFFIHNGAVADWKAMATS